MAELLEMEARREGLKPVEVLVAKLSSLLERAKAGELRGFAYAAEYCNDPDASREKGTEWGNYGEPCNAGLIGGLEIVKLDLVEYLTKLSDAQYSDDPDPAG